MNAENNIGNTIRQLRKKHGLSAKQLYEGLCSASKFSKIEAGDEYPKEMLLKALMERMGELPPVKCLPLSDVNYDFASIRKELMARFNLRNFNIAEQLKDLEKHEKKMTDLERQEYFYYQSIYLRNNKNFKAALGKAVDALHITYPDFTIDCHISTHLFTITEALIINNIAITLAITEHMKEAINLLSQLEQYHYSHLMNHKKYARLYVTVVNNLAGWVGMQGKFEESLRLSQRGLEHCKKFNDLDIFPTLLYTQGYTLCQLGRVKEGKKYMRKSFIMFLSMGKEFLFPEMKQDVTNSFGEECWNDIKADVF